MHSSSWSYTGTFGAYRLYVVSVLLLAYFFAFADGQIMALLVEPMRADLGLSDFQIGLLQGWAFSLFYAVMGVPIATLADRLSRRNIIAAGIALWGAMNAACGLGKSDAGRRVHGLRVR